MPRLLILLVFCPAWFMAQDAALAAKYRVLEAELSSLEPERPSDRAGVANTMLTFYQRHVSALISAECLYTLSCSRYSRAAIRRHGLVHGMLMSADRVMRCASFCGRDIPEFRKNEEGFAVDNP